MADVVATKEAPQAIGPYSQAIKAGGFVFSSGQIAIDPATGNVVSSDIAAQTERVMKNHGFRNVKVLTGGLPAWKKANLPLQDLYPELEQQVRQRASRS